MTENFYFKYDKHQGDSHNWIYVTSFGDEPEKEQFFLSNGDWDGNSGDLDEWVHVSYQNVDKVIALLTRLFPDWEQHTLSEESKAYSLNIPNNDIKKVFHLLYIYCSKNGNDMDDFKKLLNEEGIPSFQAAEMAYTTASRFLLSSLKIIYTLVSFF